MKIRYTLLVFLSLAYLTCSAQYPKLRGLGRFIVGVTTVDSLYAMESTFSQPIRAITDDHDSYLTPISNGFIQLISNNEPGKRPEGAAFSTDATIFKSTLFQISGIELMELELTFYKNILMKIRCEYNEELKDGLIAKYGKPATKTVKSPVRCYYKLTGKTEGVYNNEVTQRVWLNGTIKALLHYQYTYNKQCEPEEVSYLEITNMAALSGFLKAETAAMRGYLDKATAQKKKQYKDL